MEFWGAEVKSGEPVRVDPGEGMVLHLSQACLGEVKKDNKGNESVCLFVNVDGKKLVLGTLFSEKLPQQQFDLVFDRNFELSHNWKNGSIYFYGYRANNPFDESEDEDESDSDSEDDLPLHAANNGKPETEVKQEKPSAAVKASSVNDSAAGKQKVKIVEPTVKPEDSEDSDQMSTFDSDSDEDEDSGSESDDDEEDDESDEDEETPKKAEPSKKRPAESATKTPGADKKAKLVTPQKTDGKKGGGHVATPHPSKQAGKKTPANKANQQTPKSGGSHSCTTCHKSFNSEKAVESHTKAKHSAGK